MEAADTAQSPCSQNARAHRSVSAIPKAKLVDDQPASLEHRLEGRALIIAVAMQRNKNRIDLVPVQIATNQEIGTLGATYVEIGQHEGDSDWCNGTIPRSDLLHRRRLAQYM